MLLGAVWRRLLFPLPTALAMNLFSAACTVLAAVISARLVERWTGDRAGAIAGALIAALMSTAWLNATETEVYAPSLLLAVLIVAAGDRAGREAAGRWTVLTCYLVALAVPLHLSALVATPAAALLAAWTHDDAGERRWRWPRALLIGGAGLTALGASALSIPLIALGLAAMVGASVVMRHPSSVMRHASRVAVLPAIAVVVLALSALLFMLVRAQHDPGLNQGDPSTIDRWLDVIVRRQYAISSLWPRRAPVWLQVANVAQYADWQIAVGYANRPEPSIPRLAASLAFAALAIAGGRAAWRADRRGSAALVVLLAAGTLGAAAQLNLRAGPSIGWGILPDDAPHEPRERDYFFVLGFWSWGLLAGAGAAALLRRVNGRPRGSALAPALAPALAVVPLVLNWPAANRRAEPRASIAPVSARALLESAPPRAVLLSAGDNDTYPLWYAQLVERRAADVVVVALPLLGARWYRAELARRHRLLPPEVVGEWRGLGPTVAAVATGARAAGRPLAASPGLDSAERAMAARDWTRRGWVYVSGDASRAPVAIPPAPRALLRKAARSGIPFTSAEAYVIGILACVERSSGAPPAEGSVISLDSLCNRK